MSTTITLNTATYNKAKTYADEHHMTVNELLVVLINSMPTDGEYDEECGNLPNGMLFNPDDHTQEEIDARFDEIEKELEEEEGITHDEMMSDLKKEFEWLR